MSSAAAVQPLTPAELETCLAALGIPHARLIAASPIKTRTWRDWCAGRTRPRPDKWAAVTAAFDALVAEATLAQAEVEPEAAGAPGAAPIVLSGSSAPSGAPPSFTPIATAVPAAAAEESAPVSDYSPTATATRNLSTMRDLINEVNRLSLVAVDCQERIVLPPVPEALFRRAEDGIWSLFHVVKHESGRRWYPPDCMDELRAKQFTAPFVDPGGCDRRRRNEIVAAHDDWATKVEAARAVSGLDIADAELEACGKRLNAFRNAILDRPAENFGDILAKAAVVSWFWVDAEEDAAATFAADRARLIENGCEHHLSAIAAAILSDLARMAVARGLTLDHSAPPSDAGSAEAPIAVSAA